MSINIGTLEYDLIIDDGDASKKLGGIGGDAEKAAKGLRKIDPAAKKSSASLKKMSSQITSASKVIVGMAAAAATAAAAFTGFVFKETISAASDLEESINAVNVTFEENAEGIKNLSNAAASNLGLSKNEFNAAAVQFSNFATTVAGEGGDVVGTIDELTTRGADFASVMNLEVSDALGLFQSGLAGQSEPLRQYGIDVSAATVESFAYANGIAEVGSELTEAQKVQARYGSILEQTAKVQGDFANTSNSLANQQRIIAAGAENLKAEFGSNLTPVLENFIANLLPKLEQFWADNGEAITNLAVKIAELASGAILFLVDGFTKLITYLNENRNVLEATAYVVGTILVGAFVALAVAAAPTVLPIAAMVAVLGTLGFMIYKMVSSLRELIPVLKEVFINLFERARDSVKEKMQAIQDTVERVKDKLRDIFEKVKETVKGAFDNIKSTLQKAVDFFKQNFNKIVIAIAVINPPIAAAILAVKFLKDNWQDILQKLSDLVRKIFDNLKIFFTEKVPEFLQTAKDLAQSLLDGMKELPSKMLQAGKDTIDGFIGGIKEKAGAAVEALKEFAASIPDAVKKVLGIQSPSRVFKELGGFTAEGFLLGVQEGEPAAIAAMQTFAENMKNEVEKIPEDLDFAGAFTELERTVDDAFNEASDAIRQFVSENQDAQEQIRDELAETESAIKDLTAEFNKANQEAESDFQTDAAQIVLKAKEDQLEIQKQIKALEGTNEEGGNDERILELRQQLAEVNAILATQKEEGVVSAEALAEAERQATLNPLEALLERYEAEKEARALAFEEELAQLEERKLALETSLAEREEQFRTFTANLESEDKRFSQVYISELKSRESATIASINSLIIYYNKLAAAKRAAGRHDGGFHSGGHVLPGFADGGFTAKGHEWAEAGVVHRGEWVAPKWMVEGLPSMFRDLESARAAGPGQTIHNNGGNRTNHITINNNGPSSFQRNAAQARFHLRYA